jgi:two-component system alkaline phosphatase synthesis response regulator PhoP
MDGNDILKYLYKNSRFSQLTIIVVSGRSEEIDVVLGFEFGADDYIHKPIRKRELIARINANINRKNINIADSTETIKFGDSQFDSRKKQLKKNGKTIKLTPKEYYLLQFFLSNPNRISSRKEILGSVWDASAAFETRTVDMHVKMLRRKIGDDNGDIIETVRGMGYRFNMEAV